MRINRRKEEEKNKESRTSVFNARSKANGSFVSCAAAKMAALSRLPVISSVAWRDRERKKEKEKGEKRVRNYTTLELIQNMHSEQEQQQEQQQKTNVVYLFYHQWEVLADFLSSRTNRRDVHSRPVPDEI